MNFFKHHLWSVVTLGLVVSFILPAIGILISPFLHPLFMFLMFLSTLSIDLSALVKDAHHPKKSLIVLLIIHLLSPFVVFLCRPLFSQEIYLGLIIATSVPSGISGVFLTHLFKGDTTHALFTTSLSNIISPLILPLSILLFARTEISIHPLQMALTTIKLIFIPAICAHFVSRTSWKARFEKRSTDMMLISLLLIIIGIISPVRSYLTDNILLTLTLCAFVGTLISLDFYLGYSVGGHTSEKIAYGITASFKNFALATLLALSYFNGVVALPAITYTIMTSLLLIPMQWFIEGKHLSR